MIERRRRVASDRAKIAAVIYNRLAIGMPLGIDATIGYIDPDPSNGTHRVRLRDRQPVQHPAAHRACRRRRSRVPGIASLDAALHPADVPYLYYVLCGDDGQHRFSVGYQQFLADKAELPWLSRRSRARACGGATRTVGVIGWPVVAQPVARDPQRGVRRDGARLGLRAAAGASAAARGGARRGSRRWGSPVRTSRCRTRPAVAELIDDLLRRRRGGSHAVNTIVCRRATASRGRTPTRPGSIGSCGVDAGFDPSGRDRPDLRGRRRGRACALALARGGARSTHGRGPGAGARPRTSRRRSRVSDTDVRASASTRR